MIFHLLRLLKQIAMIFQLFVKANDNDFSITPPVKANGNDFSLTPPAETNSNDFSNTSLAEASRLYTSDAADAE